MKNKLNILTFHRIIDTEYFIPPMALTPDTFDSLLKTVLHFYEIIDLKIAVDKLKAGEFLGNKIAITFDDGYIDNYDIAMPILKKYDAPATFFVPVDQIESNEPYWWDCLYFLVKKNEKRFKDFFVNEKRIYEEFKDIDCFFDLEVDSLCRELVRRINMMADHDRNNFLSKLRDNLGVYLGERLLMNWDEIIRLSNNGHSIGSHTITHTPLTDLSEKNVHKELLQSKKILEQKIKKTIPGFCYPRGAWNEKIEKQVKKANYDFAVTTEFGKNYGNFSFFSMKRKHISEYSGLRSLCPMPFYLIEISGFFDNLLSKRR